MAAAEQLAEQGINAEVIDLRCLVPLDAATVLRSVAKTRRGAVLHAAAAFCGPGAEIASIITEELFGRLHGPVVRLGGANTPVPFAEGLVTVPTVDSVVTAVHGMF
jgi:pyruvate dehydrogenase E1 component beta subunit